MKYFTLLREDGSFAVCLLAPAEPAKCWSVEYTANRPSARARCAETAETTLWRRVRVAAPMTYAIASELGWVPL